MAETTTLQVDELSNLKVADLKRELKDRGLPVSGNKTELIERLQEHLQRDPDTDDLENTIGLGDVPGDDNDSDISGADDELLQEIKTDMAEISETNDPEIESLVPETEPTKPVFQKITMSTKEEEENGIAAKSEALSADEKIKQRAERFGVQSVEGKKQSRAERFGLPTKSSSGESKSGAITHTPITADDIDKLKKRAERFGTVVSTSLSKAEDAGKLKQRAERFGAVVSPTLSKVDEQERILKRKERFGALAGGTSTGPVLSSDEVEAKKQKRAERFAMS